MPGVRGHDPLVIEQFNGWWARGDDESCPSDHFIKAENVQYFNSGVETRDPLDKYLPPSFTGKVLRFYNYVMQTGQSLLVLLSGGKIYHVISRSNVSNVIFEDPEMTDFGFVAYNGRAYITPFTSYQDSNGQRFQLGLPNRFIHVYKGDGQPARKAAGFPPTNDDDTSAVVYGVNQEGRITAGIHVFAVTFGHSSQGLGPSALPVLFALGDQQAAIDNLPIGPEGTESRTIWATDAIDPNNWNAELISNYIFYFIKDIPDNTSTATLVDFSDDDFVKEEVEGGPPLTETFSRNEGGTPNPTSGGLTAQNTMQIGYCDIGLHIVGVVYETDTGFLTAPGPEVMAVQTYVDPTKAIYISGIPKSSDPAVVRRHLVSSRAITNYNGDDRGYQLYFIPEATLENKDNAADDLLVSYYDIDLLADASHLVDNFSEIPACVNLNTYHSRMVCVGEYGSRETLEDLPEGMTDNRSIARVSAAGEPEAISKVDGLLIAPLDGNALTNAQEFRDVLYLFKKTRTYAYSDNGDEPATWKEEQLDQGVGAPVHGIGTVLDSGGVNIDFLLIADWSGLMLFNGTYARPELSWKIEDFWMGMDRNYFDHIQIINNSLDKKIWMTLPHPNRHILLYADYANGLDAKAIRWAKWLFDVKITSLTLVLGNTVLVGVQEEK